jgi:DNA-binding CsgD family transcriptional regulator
LVEAGKRDAFIAAELKIAVISVYRLKKELGLCRARAAMQPVPDGVAAEQPIATQPKEPEVPRKARASRRGKERDYLLDARFKVLVEEGKKASEICVELGMSSWFVQQMKRELGLAGKAVALRKAARNTTPPVVPASSAITTSISTKVKELVLAGRSQDEVARTLNISTSSVKKIKREEGLLGLKTTTDTEISPFGRCKIPPRGLFIARGVINTLEMQLLRNDPERSAAFWQIINWCQQQLGSPIPTNLLLQQQTTS